MMNWLRKNTLKKKNSVDESKIAKEKNYINSMIDICLSKGPDDTPKELRDMLIKSATNISSTKKIELDLIFSVDEISNISNFLFILE